MLLKELLEEDGYTFGDDRGIVVDDGCCTMAVSRRYLEGGWKDVLNKKAIRLCKGQYQTID